MKPGLHWTTLPEKHKEIVAPHIHPNLIVPCFRMYLWHALWVREDYLGRPVVVNDGEHDSIWPSTHASHTPAALLPLHCLYTASTLPPPAFHTAAV